MIYYEEEGKTLQKKEVLVMSMRHTKKGEGSKRSQKKTKKGVKKEYKKKD